MTEPTSPAPGKISEGCILEDGVTVATKDSSIAELLKAPAFHDTLHNATHWLLYACNNLAEQSGWWIDTTTKEDVRKWEDKDKFQLWVLVKLALVASEVFEGFEGARKDIMDNHLPQFKMRDVEIADAVIRAFDLAGGLDIPLGEIIVAKLQYNANRADHKLENRVKDGGKSV